MKWSSSFAGRIRSAIGLALILLCVMVGLSFWSVSKYRDDSNLVERIDNVISHLKSVRSSVNEAESSQLGYLLTQQDQYLAPYNKARSEIPTEMNELQDLLADIPVQKQNLAALQALIEKRIGLLEQGLAVYRQQGFETARNYILTNDGVRIMGQIEDALDRMVAEERSLLQTPIENARSFSTLTSLGFLMLALISGGSLVLLAFFVRQYRNDRLVAELQLTEQKNFLKSTLDNSPIGEVVIDKDHKVLIWNPALENLTGFTSTAMVGTTNAYQAFYPDRRQVLGDMVMEQDFSQLDELYQDYKLVPQGKGKSIQVERWFHDLNGIRRYVAFEANPIYNQDGEIVAAMTTFQDLTSYKKIEDALRESETRFRLLIEKINVGVTLHGPNSEVLLTNDSAVELLGFTKGQLMGRTSYDPAWKCILEDGTDLPGDKHPVPQAIHSKKPVRNLTLGVYRPKSESWVWLLVNAEPLLDEEGYVSNVICSFSDITERKKVEQLKTEFISVVSHELRTPLTSILGSLGLIMGGVAGPVTPAARSMLDIAHKNSERLVRLINDILDIEKIESGKMIFHMKPLELAQVVEQAIESTRSFAEQYNVTFECEIEHHDGGFRASADHDRLTQVLINLLSNASKFSPPSEPVSIKVAALNERVVRISVTDRGSGIPDEFRGRIFQKFAQADSSDTRQKGGTGLGLSISKAIVERHKGTIGFISVVGKGTTFFIDLPLLVDGVKTKMPYKLEMPPQAIPSRTPLSEILKSPALDRSLKILICEDDRDVAMLLYHTLRHLKFNCDIAYSATEARQLLVSNNYAVMTLDLLLPDEDGISLLRELRSQEKTRNMPIIVVSAMAERGEIEFNGQAFTVVDWIDKPIDQARLISAIENAARSGWSDNKRPRILHIEDDRDLVQVVAALLGETAVVSSARTAKEALKKLEKETFDLILLDVELPDNSSASLPELLNNPAFGSIPVVVFSGDELEPGISRKIAAGLIKSRTTNQELINTIQNIFNGLEVPSSRSG